MKSRRIHGILCGFLAFLLLSVFSGCAGKPAEPEETDAPETAPEGILLWQGAGTDFLTVIRSEDASALTKNAMTETVKALKKFLPDVTAQEDWDYVPGNKMYEEAVNRPEILIGSTTRPESAQAGEGLGAKAWAIRQIGCKLAVVAGNDWALREACAAFAAGLCRTEEGYVRYEGPCEGVSEYSCPVLVTNQRNSRVEIYDLTEAAKVSDALWYAEYSEYNIADARARLYDGKTVILAAYGASSASAVDYETKKVIWKTRYAPANPHACELVPCDGGYVFAVAGTDGNAIRFFDAASKGEKYTEVRLNDAHGALYDPDAGVVWAVGLDRLTAYEVTLEGETVGVTERTDLSASIPTSYAHELQPYRGDKDRLWITTGASVYLYSKSSKTFSEDLSPLSRSIVRGNVKGIGNFPDGSVVLITPDGDFRSWTSATLTFFTEGTFSSSHRIVGAAFYKARPFCTDYN